MKYGLVMEGGAMRGLFTAGVTDVLMENGFTFDSSVGVSAGACFGCNYKSGQHGRAIRYNLRFRNEKRYCSWSSLIHTGDMFGAEFCYHTIPEKLDLFDNDTYESNPMSFFVVGTDINTGKAVYHNCRTAGGDDLEWIRASASMPLVSRFVKIGGRERRKNASDDPDGQLGLAGEANDIGYEKEPKQNGPQERHRRDVKRQVRSDRVEESAGDGRDEKIENRLNG